MWKLEDGWKALSESKGYTNKDCINYRPMDKYFLYKGAEVWTLWKGRCRQITSHRFEKDLLKALKLAQKLTFKQLNGWRNGEYLVLYDNDLAIFGICNDYITQMTELGLYRKEKGFVIPRKLTKKQIEFAIAEWPRIVDRIKKAEAYLAKQKRPNR